MEPHAILVLKENRLLCTTWGQCLLFLLDSSAVTKVNVSGVLINFNKGFKIQLGESGTYLANFLSSER